MMPALFSGCGVSSSPGSISDHNDILLNHVCVHIAGLSAMESANLSAQHLLC